MPDFEMPDFEMPDIEFLDPQNPDPIDPSIAAPHGNPCEACGCPVEAGEHFCPACGCPQTTEATGSPQRPGAGDVVNAEVLPGSGEADPGTVDQVEAEIVDAQIVTAEVRDGKLVLTDESLPQDSSGPPVDYVTAEEAQAHRYFRCENCGSEVATDPSTRSYICPFCDSTYVIEFNQQARRQRPEFIIGFAITIDQARDKFRQWIRQNAWFRPGDLAQSQLEEKQKGVYLPFWSFSMLARSQWNARIGEHWYRTETYVTTDSKGRTVTRTRQVQETEWWPLGGRHHRYYAGYLVSGSQGLSQADAERIKPFQLPALKRYQPYFLAGWLCEEYSIDRQEAEVRCREEFQKREHQNVHAFLPGDTNRELRVVTEFSHINSDLCLLPVYILSYRYQDRVYRFLVNGQTGRVAGDKPISTRRISVAIGGGVIAALLIALLIWFLFKMLG